MQAPFQQRPAADGEGDQRTTAAHHIAATRLQRPVVALVQGDETSGREPGPGAGDGMPGAGAGVDEIQQILGEGAVGVGELHDVSGGKQKPQAY